MNRGENIHTEKNAKINSHENKLVYRIFLYKMSLVVRKPVFGFSDHVRHKPAVQSQKMAISLKFLFRKQRNCTSYVAKTKALISLVVTAKLICVFAFAYAKSRFSHDEAQLMILLFIFLELLPLHP